MQWEHLNAESFPRGVDEAGGVGVVACGVVEGHGAHLPLSTDMRVAHAVASAAAQREPAVVLPAYPWGVNTETAHIPGGLILRRELVFALLENVCDEMARNGLHKIVLYSGHGGNRFFLPLFVQDAVDKCKPYTLYYVHEVVEPGTAERIFDAVEGRHADEIETSLMLFLDPAHVRPDNIPPEPGRSLERQAHLPGIYAGVDWYAMYPEHYAGNALPASATKGEAYFEALVAHLARALKHIKADRTAPALYREYGERIYRRSN